MTTGIDQGAEFFSARLRQFELKSTPVQKSLYLGIIGLLRAQHASSVSLLKRYGYVKDTIDTLDQTKRLIRHGCVKSTII